MGFFKSKYEKQLDILTERIDMNCSNNYKDAAREAFSEFEKTLNEYQKNQLLPEKKLKKYVDKYEAYREKLAGYSHADQKPYWTKD